MDKRDLKDIQDATEEIYSTFFSTNVEFRYLLESKPNIYNELKDSNRKYSEPIILVAKVDLNPNPEEIRSDIGSSTQVQAIFEVPTICLEDENILENSIQEIKNGTLTFQGVTYNILNILPTTNVDEKFLFYNFETGGNNG